MTRLTLAKPQDLERIVALVEAFHLEIGITQTNEARRAALQPLLEGSPHGCVYLAGPVRAPIGYVVICFGWSVELGGLDGFVDEIYIRPGVRGRGIATEILTNLPKSLAAAGLNALHLEVDRSDEKTVGLYKKMQFAPRETYMLMTRRL